MKSHLPVLRCVVFLSVLVFSACSPMRPTAVEVTRVSGEAPEVVQAARDAALAYVREDYSQQAPASDLDWDAEFVTPKSAVGTGDYRFTAEDWAITVSYPVVAPEAVIYQVTVNNHTIGFRWQGEVDAKGHVTEKAAPK